MSFIIIRYVHYWFYSNFFSSNVASSVFVHVLMLLLRLLKVQWPPIACLLQMCVSLIIVLQELCSLYKLHECSCHIVVVQYKTGCSVVVIFYIVYSIWSLPRALSSLRLGMTVSNKMLTLGKVEVSASFICQRPVGGYSPPIAQEILWSYNLYLVLTTCPISLQSL